MASLNIFGVNGLVNDWGVRQYEIPAKAVNPAPIKRLRLSITNKFPDSLAVAGQAIYAERLHHHLVLGRCGRFDQRKSPSAPLTKIALARKSRRQNWRQRGKFRCVLLISSIGIRPQATALFAAKS